MEKAQKYSIAVMNIDDDEADSDQEVVRPSRTSRAADYKPQKMKAQDFSRFFTMR